MRIDFDTRTLKGLSIPSGRSRLTATDARVPGLQFELRPTGGFFTYRYSIAGRQRGIPIGRLGPLKVPDARKRAQELARMVAMGEDPMALKTEMRECPTFSEFFNMRFLTFVRVDKRSWHCDLSLYRNHLQAQFGDLKMNQITKARIQEFLHRKLDTGSAKGTANRMLVLMRYAFNRAIEWEIPGVKENPARGIKPFEENNKIERYVTPEESVALKTALQDSNNRHLLHIVALLLLTGARKMEALKSRWDDVDLAARVWRIPLSKSGKVRHITLSDEAVRCLDHVRAMNLHLLGDTFEQVPYVFPNPKTLKPYTSIFCSWDSARRKAGLADVRIHDLRHTYASTLVNNGVPLYDVQKLLGHAHIRTTERYAHLRQERLRDSASYAGRTFAHILDAAESISVPGGVGALQAPVAEFSTPGLPGSRQGGGDG